MVGISSWTPHQRHTAILLTIIGIVGTLLSILGIALPYYVFFGGSFLFCALCTNVDAQITRSRYETLAIALIGTIVSFLPRIIYGIRLRQAKRRADQVNRVDTHITSPPIARNKA